MNLEGAKVENATPDELVAFALEQGEGVVARNGALVVKTFARTGRSPDDKYIVRDAVTEDRVWWEANRSAGAEMFDALWEKAASHLSSRRVFVTDSWACADPEHRLGVRLVTELAWHALFARQLFRPPSKGELASFVPDWTVMGAPTFEADPITDGTNSGAFVALDFTRRRVLIVGTHYAGEIKKSIFTVLNFLLPTRGVFPMHCSANVGSGGDVALFFGLSGTGKTTLSADPSRKLVGDDEHGWSDEGVFNFEGGCYAKCIRLSAEKEPQIWGAVRHGAVVENVVVDPVTGEVDFDDASITENTRAAYPLGFIDGAVPEGRAGHASSIVFLTADAFGVLPPIARLSPDQAAYHFLSGFTSKLAGTETGLGAEPQITFSTCFGAPFLPLHPSVYAEMLTRKIKQHGVRVYLVNTGWTGGPFGVGERIDLDATRRMVSSAVAGDLDHAPTRTDPIFGFEVPLSIPEVPSTLLDPRETWSDPGGYDAKAKDLAQRFIENFERFSGEVAESVTAAGPTP